METTFSSDRTDRRGDGVGTHPHSEAKEEQNSELLRKVLEALPDLVFYKDTQGVYTGCNFAFAKLVGCTVEQVVGKTDFDLFPPEVAQAFTDCDRLVLGDRVPRNIEEWATYPDGRRVHVDTYKAPLFGNNGQLVGLLGRSRDITRRTLAESRMLESEAGFSAFFDFSLDFLFIIGQDGNILRVNQVVCDELGYQQNEVIGKPVWQLHPADQRDKACTTMMEMAAGRRHLCEIPLMTKNGRIIPVETRVATGRWFGADAVFGISRDVGDRKRSEAVIEHLSEIQHQLMLFATEFVNIPLERIDEGIHGALGEVGRLIKADRAYLFTYDFNAETMSNTNEWCADGILPQIEFLQDVPNQEFPYWVANHRRGDFVHIPDVESLDWDDPLYNILSKQGIQSLITLPLITPEGCIGFVGFDSVASKRVWGEAEVSLLRVLAELFANFKMRNASERSIATLSAERGMLLDTMESQVWYLKDEETYGLVNKAHADFFGMTREKMQTKRLTEFLPPEGAKICICVNRQVFEKKKAVRTTEWLVSATGDRRLFEIVKTPSISKSGVVDYVVCVANDITEKEAMQGELVRSLDDAERVAKRKADFLADMSHEIRTPLNIILGYLQIMDREGLHILTKQNVNAMRKSAEHLLELINDILNTIRRESSELPMNESEFSLGSLVEDVCSIFSRKQISTSVVVETEISLESSVFIRADKGKIRQVIMNLVGNAVKFTDAGFVRIRVGQVNGSSISLPPESAAHDGECFFMVEVEDSGVGIPVDSLDEIFKPFVKGVEDSTMRGFGLGLSLCRRYARAMGGEVTVESSLGKGSMFRFVFKAQTVAAIIGDESFAGGVRVRHPSGNVPRVLVVDDNAAGLSVLLFMLECAGFCADGVASGEEALEVLQRKAETYGLILLDKRMPGMDGWETLKKIRSLPTGSEVPVVIVTASGFADESFNTTALGGNGMLSRPVKVEELLQLISKLTGVVYDKIELEKAMTPSATVDSIVPNDADLVVPEKLRRLFESAVYEGDIVGMRSLVSVMTATNPALASSIQSLVEDYDYDGLTALLEKSKMAFESELGI